MAQSVGAVALDIVMGKNTVSGVVKQAMNDVQKTMSDASAGVGQKVSAVGSAVTSMGAAILPTSTAVAALGKGMIQTAADFDSAMSEVSAISGATGSDLDALREKAQEMGAKTKFSASESAEAMKYMAMAGWKTGDMLNGISGIMNLAAASGEDLGTTSDIVTDALTAFGLQASDSGHFADVLAAASSNANTNVALLGETFKYVAPVAGAMGYSVEDMSVAIGLMANSGIKGSQAGTALRSVISRLAKPTKDSKDAMTALGLSITNNDGTMKSFNQIMLDMRGAFAGLTEEQKANYAAMLGGQEAMSGLLAIVNSSDDDFNKLTAAIGGADGTAQKMADTMNNNLNGKMTLLKSQLEGLAIELGEILIPVISKCIDAVSKFATWFGNLDESTKKTIVTVGAIVAALGPVLIVVGKGISLVGGAISAVGAIGGAISGFIGFIGSAVVPALSSFFAFIAANPIVLAITAIIGVGALLITHWEDVKAIAGKVWEGIKNIIGVVADGIKNAISAAWNFIKNITSTIFGGVKNIASTAWNGIKSVVSNVASGIKNAVSTAWNGIKSATSTVFNGIKSTVSSVWSGIKSTVSNLANGAKNAAVSAWNGIKSGIASAGNAIKNAVTNCFNGAKSTIKGFASQAVSWGKDFASGLASGIKSAASKVIDAAKSLGSKIKSFLHFSRPDEGPLRDYETWMPDFVQGMANGINANKHKLIDAVKSMASEMTMPTLSTSTAMQAPALKNIGANNAVQAQSTTDSKIVELIKQLANSMQQQGDITIPIYLGNELLDERIVSAGDRRTVRSGGRA